MYWKEFGPLPMEKNGKKVLDLIMSQRGITYNGSIQDWITVKVCMVDTSKPLGLLILSETGIIDATVLICSAH